MHFRRFGQVLATVVTIASASQAVSAPTPATATAAVQSRGAKSGGPGLGVSKAAPVGSPFILPDGVALETPVVAWVPNDPVECDDKYAEDGKGSGDAVALCLVFRNDTGRPINVTLPPGLIFVSRNDDSQNGVIVETITFEVPPGERFFAPILAYCVNIDRTTTGREDRYDLGPVLDHPGFQELFALLAGKTLTVQDGGLIQSAVHAIADGVGLSEAQKLALRRL